MRLSRRRCASVGGLTAALALGATCALAPLGAVAVPPADQVTVAEGPFVMGDDQGLPDEAPRREQTSPSTDR